VSPAVPPVVLSTASVWPERVDRAFEMAADLGYDGVEVMVWTDPASQDLPALARLSRRSGMPIMAVHAPCLLITQRVWASDPVLRLRLSADAAGDLGASTMVIHPPFRWQRRYAQSFRDEVLAAEARTGVRIAVENMFPIRRGALRVSGFQPSPDPTDVGYPHYTLDLSHTATSGQDALALMDRMGAGLVHVHLTDGTGSRRDEHLVPGRGTQPVAAVCERLVREGFGGTVCVEITTRQMMSREERLTAVSESLLFARLHMEPVR
jgi:sugar phosphate isomerase/epimerase